MPSPAPSPQCWPPSPRRTRSSISRSSVGTGGWKSVNLARRPTVLGGRGRLLIRMGQRGRAVGREGGLRPVGEEIVDPRRVEPPAFVAGERASCRQVSRRGGTYRPWSGSRRTRRRATARAARTVRATRSTSSDRPSRRMSGSVGVPYGKLVGEPDERHEPDRARPRWPSASPRQTWPLPDDEPVPGGAAPQKDRAPALSAATCRKWCPGASARGAGVYQPVSESGRPRCAKADGVGRDGLALAEVALHAIPAPGAR